VTRAARVACAAGSVSEGGFIGRGSGSNRLDSCFRNVIHVGVVCDFGPYGRGREDRVGVRLARMPLGIQQVPLPRTVSERDSVSVLCDL